MLIRKGYKFRLEPNRQQLELFIRFVGCNRFVWNRVLSMIKESLDSNHKYLGYGNTAKLVTEWKRTPELSFLREVHSQTLQQTLMDLDRTCRKAFKHQCGFPHFKQRNVHDSFRYPQGVSVDGNRVRLPKLGIIKFRKSRNILGTLKNTTITKSGKHLYVSFQTEHTVPDPIHPSTSSVGIDLGIVNFATLSDGTVVKPCNSYRNLHNKLTLEQRKLACKVKRSKNYKKQKTKVNLVHTKIKNVRKDYLNKLTTTISKNHAMVVLEDLKVSKMSESAKGTVDNHGKNVKVKSKFNTSILDQGWHEFKRQLEYKLKWNGGTLVLINPSYTSQECNVCRYIDKANRTTQSKFQCLHCGHTDNADLNASKNILRVGHTRLAYTNQ